MLAAEKLRRFAEHHRRAEVNQLVRYIADDAVGSHAGGRVGCAALDGHDDLGNICFLALCAGSLQNKLLRRINARLNRTRHAAQLLNTNDGNRLSGRGDFFLHALNVRALAAKADNQHACHVRPLAQADERIRHALEVNRQLAAALMMEIADRPLHLTNDSLRNIRRADDARDDRNQISGADGAVCAAIAVKCTSHFDFLLTDRRARAGLPDCVREHTRLRRYPALPHRLLRRI